MRFLIAALIAMLAWPAAAQMRQINHDGETRRFFVEAPLGSRPAPAVIVLHGGAGNAHRMRRITNLELAKRGFVEIYPEGIGNRWNDGRVLSDGSQLHDADDPGFLRAMIDELAAEGLVDRRRVYFTGASNGGAMTLRMVCQAPDLVAGAVVVIMNQPVGLDCPKGAPVPMIFIQGTADPLVPFDGGPVTVGRRNRGRVLSAAETLAQYALRNRCGAWEEIAITDHDPGDSTTVRHRVWRGCQAPLSQYIIDGGGHTWAGNRSRFLVEKLLGRTSRDISATFEIETFFGDLAGR
ncbi:MAG: prolyl oligopeptidase family serine peptidase [Paracoccaceae bacterium]|nr:prolyl oligopeptidase family serine peptidase [Paracoccaceae bacterium]